MLHALLQVFISTVVNAGCCILTIRRASLLLLCALLSSFVLDTYNTYGAPDRTGRTAGNVTEDFVSVLSCLYGWIDEPTSFGRTLCLIAMVLRVELFILAREKRKRMGLVVSIGPVNK